MHCGDSLFLLGGFLIYFVTAGIFVAHFNFYQVSHFPQYIPYSYLGLTKGNRNPTCIWPTNATVLLSYSTVSGVGRCLYKFLARAIT